MTAQKYELKKSDDGRFMLVHHNYPKFIALFPKGQFNKQQEIKEIDSFDEAFKGNFIGLPRLMRETGEWLLENHPETL